MQVFFITCILLGLQSSVLGACSPNNTVLWNDFLRPYQNNGVQYYISKDLYTTDMEALEVCKSICGYLVEVDDRFEMDFLTTIMNKENIYGILIAGTDKAKEGTWVSQRNGQKMSFLSWYSGEPNDYGKQEDCINLLRVRGQMLDVPCQLGFWKLNFVCEVKELGNI